MPLELLFVFIGSKQKTQKFFRSNFNVVREASNSTASYCFQLAILTSYKLTNEANSDKISLIFYKGAKSEDFVAIPARPSSESIGCFETAF
jgi:hypothetical protein